MVETEDLFSVKGVSLSVLCDLEVRELILFDLLVDSGS